MRRLILLAAALAALASFTPASPGQAQGTQPTPRLIEEYYVSQQITDIKYPHILVNQNLVNVVAPALKQTAYFWQKTETAPSFGEGFSMGPAEGQPDYSSASIAVGGDGALYTVWSSVDEGRMYMRKRDPAGAWGPIRTVATPGFSFFPEIAVTTGNEVFVFWKEVDRAPSYTRSTDSGATWSSRQRIGSQVSSSMIFDTLPLPNNQLAVVYGGPDLSIRAAFWDGAAFEVEAITPNGKLRSTPTIGIGPTGTIYVGYRGAEDSGPDSGVFVSVRQSKGVWTATQLVQGKIFGGVDVVPDVQGGLHIGWTAQPGSTPQLFYVYQRPDGTRSAPASGAAAGSNFNQRLDVGSPPTYAHFVGERFEGRTVRLRYYRFETSAAPPLSADPVIADDQAVVKRGTAVSVSFKNIVGTPTQIRWRWGAVPTDTENDSNGWQAYSNPMQISVPSQLPDTCTPTQLYTQVRDATTISKNTPNDNVILDGTVTASVSATNPYMVRSPIFTGANPADQGTNSGASDGAPGYTRTPTFYLLMSGAGECSALKDAATGISTTTIAPAFGVNNNFYANIVPFPAIPTEGPTSVLVRVSDSVGNVKDYEENFIYDVTAPVLNSAAPGTLTVTPGPQATLLASLSFSNVQVTDNLYPGRGFWGVWLAVSRAPVANPTFDETLVWYPMAAPDTGGSFTISPWSLASGLSDANVTPGTYYVYARFLDGAGNPTSGYLQAQVALSQVTSQLVYTPLVIR